jgi:hypothetical protein
VQKEIILKGFICVDLSTVVTVKVYGDFRFRVRKIYQDAISLIIAHQGLTISP